jgi:FtsH Extracellular
MAEPSAVAAGAVFCRSRFVPDIKNALSQSYNPPAFQPWSSCVPNRIKNIAFWMVILLSGVLMWQVLKAAGTGSKEAEISFSRFLQDVDHGDVSEVTIVGSEVHGKYKSGGAGFHTTAYANDPEMIKNLRENGVNITVKDKTDNGWSTYLLNLSPLILFAALWFVMIRQLRVRRVGNRTWHSATTPPPFSVVQGESLPQSPRLVLANSEGALAFGHCRSQNGQITFYPETQIGPVVAWMLAPIPPTELLGLTK